MSSAMFDPYSRKGRILAAALGCAASKRWAEVTLLDIAEGANLSIGELREEFGSKADIIAGLLRAIDDEVLKRLPKRTEGQEKRDRLFDIIMTRFDVLGPHKAALKSLYAAGAADLALAIPYLSSQHWMLQAAGIGTDGATGAMRVAGLDRRLRRGERTLGSIEHLNVAVSRFGEALGELARGLTRGRPIPSPPPGPDAGQV